MRTLEAARGCGRDDYPVRALWNSVLAGIVFQHPTIESCRELSRNGQLRVLCGFAGPHAPPASASTRFLRRVMDQLPMIAALSLIVWSMRCPMCCRTLGRVWPWIAKPFPPGPLIRPTIRRPTGVGTGMPIMAKRTIADNEPMARLGPKRQPGLGIKSI